MFSRVTMSNVFLVRTLVSGAALGALLGCGSSSSGTQVPLEIHQLNPSTIGARTPDWGILINGTGFTSDSRVILGNVELGMVGYSTTTLVADIRGGTAGTTGPGTLSVSVKNADGTRSNELPLVVAEAPAPILSEVSSNPCSNANPMGVTLNGDNFTIDTILESNGQPVSIRSRTRSSISFSVPRVSGPYSFKVTVPPPGGGEATLDYVNSSRPLDCD